MKEIFIFLGIVIAWYLLQAHILPRMGVAT